MFSTTFSNVVPETAPKFDLSIVKEKRKLLDNAATQLKSEFFGLDEIIDKVISSIHAWYIFPEIITRPVIINLWGMTGVGKTQLVRRLVSLLGFQEKFVEVQMDGGSVTSTYNSSSLTSILSSSPIEEGHPGILLLDEIQRFRTVDEMGADVKVERFQDVWALLSDGKFSSDSSMFNDIEMMIVQQQYYNDMKPDTPSEGEKPQKAKKFKIYPWEAKSMKKTLRLTEPVAEIMTWDIDKLYLMMDELKESRNSWEIDYTKLVIFVSGNLDNAFVGSGNTDDCDTDADFFHEETKKITSTEIKQSLRSRFRPEQISRLGNNHIIYPSMSKTAYKQLIESTCKRYIDEMTKVSHIEFELTESIYSEIYNNSVYPTQGTRPVFSSIHMIFSGILANITFWCLENEIDRVRLMMSYDAKNIVALDVSNHNNSKMFPVELEINAKKAKTSLDTKTIIAVHEAGHAVAFAILRKCAPIEVKINTASFSGGYMLPVDNNSINTKQSLEDSICIYLAGQAAEEIIFGEEQRTNGASGDVHHATSLASSYIRNLGFGDQIGFVNTDSAGNVAWLTMLDETNEPISALLISQAMRAKTLLKEHLPELKLVVNQLLQDQTITQKEFVILMADYMTLATTDKFYDFNQIWLEKASSIN